ncbi:hypothetical protein BDY24DRAFT_391117 [Mrakia frigida]|uniref:WW domain-containing protein n=1 Tax=Mrakia frigida TaxID=29902 RepID=UPI003FCC0B8F
MSIPSSEPPLYSGRPSQTQPGSDDLAELSDDELPSARHLAVPHIAGMNDVSRRSMEDEERELPEGWIRQFDQGSGHQFFVNTEANPPRSIWTHPFDEDECFRSNPDSRPHQPFSSSQQQQYGLVATPSLSQAEIHEREQVQENRTKAADVKAAEKSENRSFGEKMKDKLTGSTKAERDADKRKKIAAGRERQQRQQEEFLARRQSLIQYQQDHRNDPGMQRYYPTSSTQYNPPLTPYSRASSTSGGRKGGGGGMEMPLVLGNFGGMGGGIMMHS